MTKPRTHKPAVAPGDKTDLDREWPAVVQALDAQLRAAQAETRRRYTDAPAPTGLGVQGRAMVESPRFLDAFDGFEGTFDQLVGAVGALHGELERLAWFAREYAAQGKDNGAVVKSVRETKRVKAQAAEHLLAARKLLDGAYGAKIDALLAELRGDANPARVVQLEVMMLGADAFGERGGAAPNRGALNGAAIMAVAAHVPAERRERAALIRDLLKLAGFDISNQTITSRLRREKNEPAAAPATIAAALRGWR